MKAFSDYNPIAVFFCLAGIALVCMFSMDPWLLLPALAGAAMLFFARNGREGLRECRLYPLVFLCSALLNPLFMHKGVTVLFVLNDNPITLESLVYGCVFGVMLTAVLWWFRSFTQIMTADKLLYLLGSVSPKLALILSMTLRYLPLFRRQAEKTSLTQQAIGVPASRVTPEEEAGAGGLSGLMERVRRALRVFSVMVTWALENGVITADSMTARGYGVKPRTHFAPYRFRRSDARLLVASMLLTLLTLLGSRGGAPSFYPQLLFPRPTALAVIGRAAYILLCQLPAILEIKEMMKWKSLRSTI